MERKAFTLVELLVVISLIVLLISILLPSLATARGAAKSMVCTSKQRQVGFLYAIHIEEQKGYLLVPTAGGVRWAAYFSNKYPQATLKPLTAQASLAKSLFICPSDDQPYGHPTNTYTFYTIEMGGSYLLNADAYSYGPSGGWTAMGGNRSALNAKEDISWRGERSGAIKVPAAHLSTTDGAGVRSYGMMDPGYFLARDTYLTRLPDPLRHPGRIGNLLFLDGHVKAVKSEDVLRAKVRWDNQ